MKKLFLIVVSIAFLRCSADFKVGIEAIPQHILASLQQANVGLVTNQTGITQNKTRSVDYLLELGINVVTLYAPEHGITGKEEAGIGIADVTDEITGVPVVSLYEGDVGLCFKKDLDLTHLDYVLFDMQDSGMRHYTYISIMFYCMQVAAEQNIPFIVLDRPNPLGWIMEGPLVEPDLLHFVAIAPLPVRHALTIGEIALYFNEFCLTKKAALTVVRMPDYERTTGFDNGFLIGLSPNLQSTQACFGYSFGCILDNMRPFDVALDTKEAFQWIGLPEKLCIEKNIDWQALIKICQKHGINTGNPTVQTDHPHFQEPVKGINFTITDINSFSAINFLCEVINWIQQYDITFKYRPLINHIIGSKDYTQVLEGKLSIKSFKERVNKELVEFNEKIQPCLLYEPKPQMALLV
ncbi:MAG: DUF1343 domain-containing protein [Proteobacteria bacterium]|nr:DUF1343 domain-containing protein [Pseudomonadota bacterium]NBP15760.1 DUF1343 domain-containing protein [bacterium]